MKSLRIFILIAISFMALSWFSQQTVGNKTNSARKSRALGNDKELNRVHEKLKQKAAAARTFVKRNNYNNKICFLLDMSQPSGQNRFVIYDLVKDSIRASGLVAHGNCFEYWLEGRRYSNVVGSGCTSLGKYKIGSSYTGKFGYSYKLHGLDSSNNNAFERTVVLHAHSCVPDAVAEDEICQSNGCPTVSPNLLVNLKSIINSSTKPILLWIYE